MRMMCEVTSWNTFFIYLFFFGRTLGYICTSNGCLPKPCCLKSCTPSLPPSSPSPPTHCRPESCCFACTPGELLGLQNLLLAGRGTHQRRSSGNSLGGSLFWPSCQRMCGGGWGGGLGPLRLLADGCGCSISCTFLCGMVGLGGLWPHGACRCLPLVAVGSCTCGMVGGEGVGDLPTRRTRHRGKCSRPRHAAGVWFSSPPPPTPGLVLSVLNAADSLAPGGGAGAAPAPQRWSRVGLGTVAPLRTSMRRHVAFSMSRASPAAWLWTCCQKRP